MLYRFVWLEDISLLLLLHMLDYVIKGKNIYNQNILLICVSVYVVCRILPITHVGLFQTVVTKSAAHSCVWCLYMLLHYSFFFQNHFQLTKPQTQSKKHLTHPAKWSTAVKTKKILIKTKLLHLMVITLFQNLFFSNLALLCINQKHLYLLRGYHRYMLIPVQREIMQV